MASAKFKDECKNRANKNRLGKIVIDGINNPITNSDNLQSFTIDSGCYIDGSIIGSVYAKCLKANFISDIENLSNKNLQAHIGVKFADTGTEYVSMGKYTIQRPNNEITANLSQITAYDSLYTNLDSKYVCNIDYSKGNITLGDIYVDVCNQLGLVPVSKTFLNSNIPVSDNPFTNGEKNRLVLQTIAKIACSFIDINNNTNKIDLCWLSTNKEPDYTFYKNDYSKVEGGKIVCGPINCLIIKNSQVDDENITIKDEQSISLNGERSITISDDYILHNAQLRQQAITAIWNRVKGTRYVDCKLTTFYGKPFLKLGDKIRVYTSDTEYFDTYVLKHKFTYDGTFESVIESPALTQLEIKTKQDISLGEALRNTQIDVNKQKGIITGLVESQNTIKKEFNFQKSASGSNIHIEDASDNKLVDFELEGKSWQATRSGKNLITHEGMATKDISDYWISYTRTTALDDGWCKVEFDNTSGSSNAFANQFISSQYIDNIVAISKYTALVEIRNVVCDATDDSSYLQIGGTQTPTLWSKCNSIRILDSEGSHVVPLTTKSDLSNSTIGLRNFVSITAGHKISLEYRIMLVKGEYTTEQIGGYEPYGAMPSSEYPSEIKSVGYENLFDGEIELGSINPNTGDLTSSAIRTRSKNFIKVKPNTTYSFSKEVGQNRWIIGYTKDKVGITDGGYGGYSSAILHIIVGQDNAIFTATPTTEYIKWYDTDSTNLDEKVQISLGTILRPYIPYGKYGVEVVNTGKNLWGDLTWGTSTYRYFKLLKLDTYYTLSIRIKDGVTIPSDLYLGFTQKGLYDPSQKAFWLIQSGGLVNYKTKDNFYYFNNLGYLNYVSVYPANYAKTLSDYFEIQLEEGREFTNFEEYQFSTSLFVLNEPLRSLPNGVADRLFVKNNLLCVERKIGTVIFDGKEDWQVHKTTDDLGVYYTNISNSKLGYQTSICSHFTNVDAAWGTIARIGIYSDHPSLTRKYFVSSQKTLEEWKQWLSTHNVKVQYELAESHIEEVGEIEIPSTFKGVNNISTTDELEPNMNITYLTDSTITNYVEGQLGTVVEIQERKNAEFKIQDDEIKQTVTQEITNMNNNLDNNYMTSDQINSQTDSLRKDIDYTTKKTTELSTTIDGVNIKIETLGAQIQDMNFSFTTDALQISNSQSKINSKFNNTGVKVYNYDKLMAIFNHKGSGVGDLIVTGTAQIGYLKFMKSTKNGKPITAIHHVVSEIQTLEDLESDD